MTNSTRIARFSIREVLFVMAIVALAIPLYRVTNENLSLQKELNELRNESGLLTKTEENSIHLIAIPSASPKSQAWRISVPPEAGDVFQVVFAQSNIPVGTSGALPDPKVSPSMAFTIPPNDLDELVFRIELKEDPAKISWSIDGLTGSEIDVEPEQAVWSKTMTEFSVNAKGATIAVPLGEPIELLTAVRRWDDTRKTWVNKDFADGIKIWLRSFPDLNSRAKQPP